MAEFVIRGGRKLKGKIEIAGSKNTALSCIAAALLTEEEVLLENVPKISDVAVMTEIAKALGAAAEHDLKKKTLRLCAKNLAISTVPETLGKKLRASMLFSGALVGRLKLAKLAPPGGDNIGARPLATHLNAFRALGATVEEREEIVIRGEGLRPSRITLEEPSVTATENAIFAAVLIPGKTEIHLAAAEPHVQETIKFLNQMGAKINWKDIGVLEIEGAKKLKGTRFRLNPDELEVSGFAALAAATRSPLSLYGVEFKYLDAVLLQLDKMGIAYEREIDNLHIKEPGKEYRAFRIQSGLYPKLVSDHLPPFAVLATQATGDSLIHEWLYEGRLKYIEELKKMGATTRILDPHRALIQGPTRLQGTQIVSYDIRAGLTVIVAALVAEGETKVLGVEHVERGYENLEERLQKLGADIKRIN
ncbi:MAG: UDP-N-acetylglucosamine 1-carboxyvinyltransferase [bacterium]|nr:UDP-N-acetylglucosamine 1-carboxyvinyltransferase [bacterium]